MAELDLLVLGDVNPDIIVSSEHIDPRFDQVEQLVDSIDLVVGGSASITALATARLGLRVGLGAVVGGDTFGAFMMKEVASAGVDVRHVRVEPLEATGVTVVLARETDRAILTAPGCMEALDAADLAEIPDRPARHVHIASYYLMGQDYRGALPAALQRFRAAGVSVSLDTNWDSHEEWHLESVLKMTDLFLPNRAELTAIAGTSVLSDALASVGSVGPTVVTKLAERGAIAWDAGMARSVRASASPDFVDAVGAGDAFNAGYITALLKGRKPEDRLRLAVATGTLSTRGRGGTAAQPTLAEAEALASTLAVLPGIQESA